MKGLWIVGLALAAVVVQAQGVTEVANSPEHLAEWLASGATIEVKVPEGATVFALNFGGEGAPAGVSAFLRTPGRSASNVLRVVVIPPDHSGGSGICQRGEGMATLFVTQGPGADAGALHHLPFCVPFPAFERAWSFPQVLGDAAIELGSWTPIYFHAWLLEREGSDVRALRLDQAFSVQVAFLDGNSTAFPDEAPLTIDEMVSGGRLTALRERFEVLGAH